uniref:Uncharacterized protein n=1 Tax=Chelonoidis abingdonii TaxID=106734 RepID=A0A8C0H8F7_CHEAB
MKLLAENGCLQQTLDVISAFGKIMSAYCGDVLYSITIANPLDQASLTELKTALSGFLAKGEVLKLETKTDLSILGVMIVGIGDKYADLGRIYVLYKGVV